MLLTSFQVMLMEVDLAGYFGALDCCPGTEPKVSLASWTKAAKAKGRKVIEAAGAFLTEHETAKIIISLDTHCLEETGFLVYSDANPNDLKACNMETVGVVWALYQNACLNANAMLQVLRDCIPYTVYQYITKDRKAPQHAHKSIILNLACGATIGTAQSRQAIFNGYDTSSHPLPCPHT